MSELLAGRYRLEELLGRGGMGWVQRATDERSGREVAIKFLKAQGETDRLMMAFSWETGAVARLAHPGVVPLYDYGRAAAGEPYIVMGLSPGTPLNQIVRSALGFETYCATLEQILQILAHTHARGVFHHDLKPGNVLVWATEAGEVKVQLIDFGIAGVLDTATAGTGRGPTELLGTASYLAPEKVSAYNLYRFSPSPDIYAVGVLSYEIAYGVRPFVADDAREVLRMHQLKEPPVLPFTEFFQAPAEMHGFIRRLLAKNPRDRFGSATEALIALRQVAPREVVSGQHRAVALPKARFKIPRDWLFASESPQEHAKLLNLRPPPFAGRRQEQHYLSARLTDSVMRQRPQVVLLTGPDGVGKSRLVNQMAQWASEGGRASAAVAPYSLSGTDSVEGWRAALLSLLGYAVATRSELAARLDDDLDWLGLEDDLERDIVLELLFPAVDAEGASVHFDWVGTFLRLLVGLARRRPLLIGLEDVGPTHDARGVEVLEFLLRTQEPAPITVLLTMASDQVGQPGLHEHELRRLERYRAYHKSHLASLSGDEMAALLDGLMPLDPGLRRQIVEGSRGLPVFGVEMVRLLVRCRRLEPTGNGNTLAEPEVDLPASVDAIWLERLSVLERASQSGAAFLALMRRAAVLGQPFTYETLREVANHEGREDLAESVGEAWSAWHAEGLWVQVAPTRSLFAHSTLLRAVLAHIEEDGLRQLHHLSGQARLRAPIHAYCAESIAIGDHFARSGLFGEAFPFYLRAAREAAREGRFLAAVTQCRHAAQLLVEGSADTWDRRWGAVYRLLAEALLELARYSDVEEIAGRLIERAEHWHDALHRAAALRLLATSRQRRGLNREAEPQLLEARALFQALGVPRELGQCELQLGELWKDSRPPQEARECFRLARRHFGNVRDSQGTANALVAEARLLRDLGQLAGAARFLDDAFNIYRRARNRAGMADVLRLRGRVALVQQRHGLALDAFAEASQLHRAIGDREGLAVCVLETGRAYRELAQLSQAEQCFRRAREEFVALGNRARTVHAHLGLVQLALDSGHFEASLPHLTHLLGETQQAADNRSELTVQALIARASAELGRWPAADAACERVAALAAHLQVCELDLARQLRRLEELAKEAGQDAMAETAGGVAGQVEARLAQADPRAGA